MAVEVVKNVAWCVPPDKAGVRPEIGVVVDGGGVG